MKKLLLIAIVLISFSGVSQTKYQNGMKKALDLWGENKPWEAVNLFERIATAEPDEWLPPFYASYIAIVQGFGEKDEAKLKAQMDKALEYMNKAKTLSKDNPEILIIDALWHTVWVAYDGATYGMRYGSKVSMLYQEALKLAPNNPRVIANNAEWNIGSARFFGNSLEPYCKDLQRAIDLFPNFKPAGEFYPKGGLERAKNLIEENCKG